MKILIDECLPAEISEKFAELGHECQTAREAGFGSKKNGELLTVAEGRWDVLVTSDKNIRFQQNMSGRKIAILVLRARSTRISDLVPLIPACVQILGAIRPGEIREVGL
jgi:predicted nuclease of predicted toxin-antitoxin system